MTVDLQELSLVIGTLLGLAALGALMKKLLKSSVAQILKELETGNGSSIANYVVKTSKKLEDVAGLSRDNRTLIEEQGRQIREVRDELVRHQATGHNTD